MKLSMHAMETWFTLTVKILRKSKDTGAPGISIQKNVLGLDASTPDFFC